MPSKPMSRAIGQTILCPTARQGGLTADVTRLLTAREVAQRLGVTTAWVWAQTRAGQIPHVQLGRYRRFREEAIEAWLLRLEQDSVNGGLTRR
jgi:excisionase family DNA binding protein